MPISRNRQTLRSKEDADCATGVWRQALLREKRHASASALYDHCIFIVQAEMRQGVHFAARQARNTDRPAMLDEIEMQAIIEPGRNESAQDFVRLFHARIRRNPAEPARDAKDVGINRKRRKYRWQLYGNSSTHSEPRRNPEPPRREMTERSKGEMGERLASSSFVLGRCRDRQ